MWTLLRSKYKVCCEITEELPTSILAAHISVNKHYDTLSCVINDVLASVFVNPCSANLDIYIYLYTIFGDLILMYCQLSIKNFDSACLCCLVSIDLRI